MNCENLVWSFARFSIRDEGLLSSLFERIFECPAKVDFQAVHAVCCATWALSREDLTWELFEARSRAGLALDATSQGFLLMHGGWQGQQLREIQVLLAVAWGASAEVLRATAARWITPDRWFDSMFHPRRVPIQSENDAGAWYRYQKLAHLINFVEAASLGADPQSVLSRIEGFVGDAHHRWLKIAGGPKAEVIDASVFARPLANHEVGVEMGCFVGYTAVRLGWRLGSESLWGASLRLGVLSTELEVVHVCIGRHHIDAARLSVAAEVLPGHIPWATPRYIEQFGGSGVGFTFMDHKGTRFHEDLGECKASQILAPWSRLLCDNVLKPGAPDHLWIHHRSSHCPPSAVVWLLHEFLEPDTEDWQSLRDDPPDRHVYRSYAS